MESEQKNITEQVKALLAESLQIEPDLVAPDLTFGDIPQWDSMGHMEVMMQLEQYFGVEINPDTIATLISLPIICEYINNMDR